MEKRAILAIALSAAILILYQLFFMPSPPPPAQISKAEAPKESPGTTVPLPAPPLPPPVVTKVDQGQGREVVVETPRFRARLTTAGGRITDWVMKYRGERRVTSALGPPPFALSLRRGGQEEIIGFPFEASLTKDLVLSSVQKEGKVQFDGSDQYQLAVTEEFRFSADGNWVDITFFLENKHRVPQQIEFEVNWILPPAATEKDGPADGVRFVRVVGLDASGLFRHPIGELSDRKDKAGGRWVAVESDDHYLAALIAKGPGARLVEEGGPGRPQRIALLFPPLTLVPGARGEAQATLYVGPKEYDQLRSLGVGLERAVDFGTFFWVLPMEWFSVPLLWLMNFIYRYTGNYGIAIILLTVLTKILFYPLTQKSMTSMKQMQALQPHLNALRAKYKNDNQRLQREMMELYRRHGVNPMGGCLPIVIQIPVFYALYVTLTVSVELQQSPLLCLGRLFGWELWICDLSKADPTYILPMLMGVTMFIQQKMTPTMGDPRQAKIMLLMPVIFTFMFLQFPTGLVLYWLVNNILSIAQQYYINRGAQAIEPPEKEGGRRVKKEGRRA